MASSLIPNEPSHDDDVYCSDPNCAYCADPTIAQEQWKTQRDQGSAAA
jgi:hypothetical protein